MNLKHKKYLVDNISSRLISLSSSVIPNKCRNKLEGKKEYISWQNLLCSDDSNDPHYR